ncbi:MAG: CDGSH iron-sulfur domain-containing protein [Deltaproteobacteria bacterium]|nr:CDGSH iron-sulfur domain-containing protein [Deltaproteobacteria bacterium]
MSSDDAIHTYPGQSTDVHWDGRLCIHVGECGRARGELFVTGRDPWGQPDLSADDEVLDVIARCPTGALTLTRKRGGSTEQAPAENVVTVSNHGPLYLRGELDIEGAQQDMAGVRFRAALCRCGLSKNKPFCDNSHEDGGFRDRGAVGESGEALESTGGPLHVRGAPNGPLLVSGNLTIKAASGRTAWTGTKTALCRCGQSQNKPFCDGSHKAAGFRSE